MRKMFLVLFPLLVGCQGVNRLIDGKEGAPPPAPKVIVSGPAVGDTPDFNVPTPAGYTKTVFHGAMPLPGLVHVTAAPDSLVDVFIKEQSIGQWFLVGHKFSEAFWYTFDPTEGTVQYHGQHLEGKEFCVYQYTVTL